MKRTIILSVFLLTVSLACRAAQRIVAPASAVSPDGSPVAPTPIRCDDDSCLNACLKRINKELAANPLDQVGGAYVGKEANFNLVIYKVNGDQISEPDILWVPSEYKDYQQDTASHQRIWNYFISIIPADQRKWLTRYVVFTDGAYNTLAWVNQAEYDDNSRWELGVDMLDAGDPLYLTGTIIHEVGHLVTLNSDQIHQSDGFAYTPYQNSAVCPQFISTEGCSTPDSYINQFYQRFWTGIYDDWLEIVYKASPADDTELRAVVEKFFLLHPGNFSREYAATNIKEDMAVSFEHFILDPRPEDNSIVSQKVKFFYEFPELVALRQFAIQGMCSYSK